MINFYRKSLIFMLIMVSVITGCESVNGNMNPLDPDDPVTVTIWHYYNGHIMDNFDGLISEFNETEGMEKGIVVDAKSLGDVGRLADAVYASASSAIGSEEMPDIFAAYPDNAIRVHKLTGLVDMESYFSEDEITEYRNEFLREGMFLNEKNHYIIPVAKSSENLFVNKNNWQNFALEHGYSDENLRTWEGIIEVAEEYKQETGGGFLGIDAVANYMLVSCMQLGTEMFTYNDDGSANFNFDRDIARRIWDNYYVPYLKGYFIKTGRFSSDDAKTGKVLAYTGSTAGAAYFPTEVTFSQGNVLEIEPLVLPYPHFRDGIPVAMQQGAGMCITKSDYEHEYASAEFLKWFTSRDNNLRFAVSTGYFPVKNEVLNESSMLSTISSADTTNAAIKASITATNFMLSDYSLYSSIPFDGSFEIRNLLETSLNEKLSSDLEVIEIKVSEGIDRSTIVTGYCSQEEFEKWYENITKEAEAILSRYK